MVILGIDPGIRHTGYCAVRFDGQRREAMSVGEFKDCSVLNMADRVRWLLGETGADHAGIEDFHWMGGDKTIGKHSLELCKLIGAIQSLCHTGLGEAPVMLRKQDCNTAIGVTGKTPKARIARAVAALFPGVVMSNEHKRDAAVVALATRSRIRVRNP